MDLPNAELTVVGDGPDRDALQAKARDLGVSQRVDFAGYKSQADVADYLKTHSVFVLPSFAEGVPVVLMEAMAAGLPVVTTKIAGVPELVEDGVSGRLVSPGDVSALADALKEMSQDPIRNSEMGAAGRATVVSEFTAANEAAWLSKLFDGYGASDPPTELRPEAGQ